MGRMLGSYADDNELDRPDLNKCPDCKCYFAGDTCPLCGKVCPDEMRAGNRKAVKVKKHPNRNQYGRVTFVPWYHSWWFILLMAFMMPIVSVILLATGPYKKWIKVVGGLSISVYFLFSTFGLGGYVLSWLDQPVDTSLSQSEYIASCSEVSPEAYYRSPEAYEDQFVTMTLTVTKVLYGYTEYSDEAITYYLCQSPENKDVLILVRECILEGAIHYMVGDELIVYGEGSGMQNAYDSEYNQFTAPAINVAYAKLIKEVET